MNVTYYRSLGEKKLRPNTYKKDSNSYMHTKREKNMSSEIVYIEKIKV